MSSRFVLDAWAVLAMLQDEEPASRRVRAVVLAAEAGDAEIAIASVNLGEVYYIVGRARGLREADATHALLGELPMARLVASDERVLAAARLKMAHRISFADAFAAAAALELRATLLTGGPELIALRGEVDLEDLRTAN